MKCTASPASLRKTKRGKAKEELHFPWYSEPCILYNIHLQGRAAWRGFIRCRLLRWMLHFASRLYFWRALQCLTFPRSQVKNVLLPAGVFTFEMNVSLISSSAPCEYLVKDWSVTVLYSNTQCVPFLESTTEIKHNPVVGSTNNISMPAVKYGPMG